MDKDLQTGAPGGSMAATTGPASAGKASRPSARARGDQRLQVLGTLGSDEPVDLAALMERAQLPDNQEVLVWLDADRDGRFADDELAYVGDAKRTLKGIALSDSLRRRLHQDDPQTIRLQVAAGERRVDFGLIAMPRKRAAALVRLRSGSLDSAALSEPVRIESGRHHVIQFARIPSADEQAQLEDLGVALLGYIPDRSFWARIGGDPERLRQTAIAGGLVLARPASAELKLDPSLSTLEAGSATVAVHFFADASEDELARIASLLARTQIERWDSSFAVIARPSFDLVRLGELEGVQWVEPYVADTQLHSGVGNLQQSVTPLRLPPYSLSGAGVKVAVFDAGWIDGSHPDLASRVSYDPSLLDSRGRPVGDTTSIGGHATRMAGVIASSGIGNADAVGAAPNAQLFSYREAYTYQNPSAMVLSQSSALGWRIINHSYGSGFPCDPAIEACKSDPHWTSYIQHAADADTWARQAGVISIYSAGNDGLVKDYPEGWADGNWSTIYSGAAGKNVIATCAAGKIAMLDETYSVRADSSKGPASDGRVKPDLCAFGLVGGGNNTFNWTPTPGGGYTTTQATSAAAAQLTGVATLLMQAYRDVLGEPTANLPPDLARGLLIHSAEDMTEENTYHDLGGIVETVLDSHAAPGPDYTTGWGYANAQAAVDLLRAPAQRGSRSVVNGQVDAYELTVPAGGSLKVTLAWTDPPAAVGTHRALVNDLDLSVQEIDSGATYYPWVLDKNLPMHPATTGINVVDNVEQVVLSNESGAALTYKISVNGSAVPQGPQPYQLLADYALTFNGSSAPSLPPTASFVFACSYLGCTFTDQSSDADGTVSAWAWDFGDGTSSSERNPVHDYASTGTYSVTLTVLDNTNLSASISQQVTAVEPARPPTANFTVVCANLECDFSDASTDPDGSVVSWQWNFGDGTTSQQKNPRHQFAAPGSYNVTLTVTDSTNLNATRSSTTTVTSCLTATNSSHYTAGRATRTGFFSYTYYAAGSGVSLGGGSTTTSLQGGNGYFTLVSSCPAPLPAPPSIGSISASVSNGVATVSGTASDINGNLSRVDVAIVSGGVETRSTATGTSSWSRSISGLAPGSYTAYAQAFDSTGLASGPSASVPFTIPVPTPEQCFTAVNSAHYSAGRASRRLQLFTYYYYAVGSNDSLGQASATTSLRGTPGNWRLVSSCP